MTESRARRPEYPLAISILDPRLEPLVQAADRWRRAAGPTRLVVDQVYLVPDVGSFFEVIAGWDERNFFPVLIDDPHLVAAVPEGVSPGAGGEDSREEPGNDRCRPRAEHGTSG